MVLLLILLTWLQLPPKNPILSKKMTGQYFLVYSSSKICFHSALQEVIDSSSSRTHSGSTEMVASRIAFNFPCSSIPEARPISRLENVHWGLLMDMIQRLLLFSDPG